MQIVELEEKLNAKIEINVFRKVTNLPALKQEVESGAIEACLLKPEVIVSPLQVALAANEALARKVSKSLITKSVFTEIIYNVSPSKNITESLKKFAAQPADDSCLIVAFCDTGINWRERVNGEEVDLADLTDVERIRRVFQIADCETAISSLENSVLTRLAAKNVQLLSK